MREKIFEKAEFIKADVPFERAYTGREPAPAFRKVFALDALPETAELTLCALGYGIFWLNGERVTEDLFLSPVSDYDKTLWTNTYDVLSLLRPGKNVLAVQLGNGFFNESFETPWKHSEAVWRDAPKFIAELFCDGESVAASNETFLCKPETAVIFNQWRIGESYDARLEDHFESPDYDDDDWSPAKRDDRPPKGVFRPTDCEPIRECESFPVAAVYPNANGWILDFGQNISGYVSAEFEEKEGTEIVLRHAEEMDEEKLLKLNGLDRLYPQVPFQTDRVICSGAPFVWKPRFVYHGFRFVEVCGLAERPDPEKFRAVFVHQDVARKADFYCSDELINWIYIAGIRAVYSNLFYSLTDCPTREKYGWTNDAQASAEQLCINFDLRRFFRKWMQDMEDAVREDGDVSAVVPTAGYGYGHGPVCDGALFEIPYRMYQYYGDAEIMRRMIPSWQKYLAFSAARRKRGEPIVLGDWDGVGSLPTPKDLLDDLYRYRMSKILALGLWLDGRETERETLLAEIATLEKLICEKYFDAEGNCTCDTQTGLSFLISEGFCDRCPKLGVQFLKVMEESGWRIDCGMVGTQYLYRALQTLGRSDEALEVVLSEGPKSYINWYRKGGTTLWETWQDKFTDSRNHHMFSGVLGWFLTDLAGFRREPGGDTIFLRPSFVRKLNFCRASFALEQGELRIFWERSGPDILCSVKVPKGAKVRFFDAPCRSGENRFTIPGCVGNLLYSTPWGASSAVVVGKLREEK